MWKMESAPIVLQESSLKMANAAKDVNRVGFFCMEFVAVQMGISWKEKTASMIRVVEAYKGMWNLHKNVNANKDMQELVADV